MTETSALHPRVAAALAASGVSHVVRRHADCGFAIKSPQDFARCLGRPVDCITKSLFLELTNPEGSAGFGVAVCPVPLRVDFSILARHWNVARVSMASRSQLADQLGYPPTGVSPLGCGDFMIAIDDSVFGHETVLVGGGAAGVEAELPPEELSKACGATRLAFAHS